VAATGRTGFVRPYYVQSYGCNAIVGLIRRFEQLYNVRVVRRTGKIKGRLALFGFCVNIDTLCQKQFEIY